MAPQSGQRQLRGTFSQVVPAGMPSSGFPIASSYIKPHNKHINLFILDLLRTSSERAGILSRMAVTGNIKTTIETEFEIGVILKINLTEDSKTMYNADPTIPVVMSFSANDPCGGSGIQADIEALGSMGCHCAPVITALTAQDTTDIYQFFPTPSRLVRDQARAVLEDIRVCGFKIGILGSIENVRAVHQILNDYPDIPVVLDPTLHVGAKAKSFDPAILEAMVALILPYVTVCTPNATEARLLASEADTLDACAQEIMAHGADYVLITGQNLVPNKISNSFYGNYRRLEVFHWDRLPNHYQGSGCTLSAGVIGLLAQGIAPSSAVHQAQEYTAECLKQAYRLGMGQYLPNRLYWSREASFEYDAKKEQKN